MESTERIDGIDMNNAVQLDLLRNQFPRFRREYEQIPAEATSEPGRFIVITGCLMALTRWSLTV